MNKKLSEVMMAMIAYDRGDARRIQHFVKVHNFAATIGMCEGLDEHTQFVLETAAILHDIGIHLSEQKYGASIGKYQEELGPDEADTLLREVGGYTEDEIERVKYLIGHHHTYTNVDGLDYQILLEADFLVNLYEDAVKHGGIEAARKNIFKTAAGTKILADLFAL